MNEKSTPDDAAALTDDATAFDDLQQAMGGQGTAAGLELLIERLQSRGEYHQQFEAMKYRLRLNLGLDPLQPAELHSLPADLARKLEDGLVTACQEVGGQLMAAGRPRDAWAYLRAVDQRDHIKQQLRAVAQRGEAIDEVIEIAFFEGIDPVWGYGLLLKQQGTCNAISTLSGYFPALDPPVRAAVAQRLLAHVHKELRAALVAHVQREQPGAQIAAGSTLPEILAAHPWTTNDRNHHADISHLMSTLGFARSTEREHCWEQALEIAAYGSQLDEELLYPGDEPFTQFFPAHEQYFRVLLQRPRLGDLEHFEQRAEEVDGYTEGTMAAEIYIELLQRTGKAAAALGFLMEKLPPGTHTTGLAPDALTLSQAAGDFERYQQSCRERNDLLGFAAGLIRQQTKPEE